MEEKIQHRHTNDDDKDEGFLGDDSIDDNKQQQCCL